MVLCSGRALIADAKDLEYMSFDYKSILVTDGLFKLFDDALVEMYALLARFADEMMVVLAWVYHFVTAFTIAELNRLDQSHTYERLERTVDRGEAWSLVVLITHQAMNILCAGEIRHPLQVFEDLFSALGQFLRFNSHNLRIAGCFARFSLLGKNLRVVAKTS